MAGLGTLYTEIVGVQAQLDVLLITRRFLVERYERRLDRLNDLQRNRDYKPPIDAAAAPSASLLAEADTTKASDVAGPSNLKTSTAKAKETGPAKGKASVETEKGKEKEKKVEPKPGKAKPVKGKAGPRVSAKAKGKRRTPKSREMVEDEEDDDADMPPVTDWATEMDIVDEELRAAEAEEEGVEDGDYEEEVDYSDSD